MLRDFNLAVAVGSLGLVAFCLQACGDRESTQEVTEVDVAPAAAVNAEAAAGVLWQTDPEAAFEEARSSGRPVMLYFTADWCPPCHDLKAHVFPQPGFIEKSRLFVPVYLDGDQPQAQMWGDKLGVIGYPTLVVMDSAGTEIIRVSGGMNLTAYEEVLETALSVTQPMDDLLASLDGVGDLTLASCRRLAYHAWSMDSAYSDSGYEVGVKLLSASEHCPAEVPVVRARLKIIAAALLAPTSASDVEQDGEVTDTVMWQALEDVYNVSQDPEQADPNALIVLSAPQEFYTLSYRFGEAEGVDVVTPWVESLARFAEDPGNTSFTRLYAIGGRLTLIRGSAEEGNIPEADIVDAREAVARFLDEEAVGYGRSALLVPAVFTLTAIGDNEAAQSLLLEEMEQSKTPYYQMSSLAELMEEAGDQAQALDWFERAYDDSKGYETRLRWGSDYVRACIRLNPNDADRIVAAAIKVINEIEDADWSARAQRNIDRLETSLTDWSAGGEHDAALAEIRSVMLEACRAIEHQPAATCEGFLETGA